MAKIGFIGMGNMGSAILNGLLRVYKPEDLLFTAAHKEKMEAGNFKSSSDFHSSGYWSPDPVWRRLRQL